MTSEVGIDLRAVHVCGVPCLQVYRVRKRSMSPYVGAFGEIAPSRKRPWGILNQEELCWISPAGCVVFR